MQTAQTETISEIAKKYAIKCTQETNHIYDEDGARHPYEFHLEMVANFAKHFIHLLPENEVIRENVIGGAWCHDLIEDDRQTYNDVKKATNEQVAELAYALTNEKGKNRAERGSDKYYNGIMATPYAAFLKICDRLANAEYSAMTGSRMVEMYRKENKDFVKKIYVSEYQEMFDHLEKILTPKKP